MIKTIHQHHLGWDPQQEPSQLVSPGEESELVLLDASGNRVSRNSDADIIETLLPENANPLTGPVFMEGAEPGDTLVVDILGFGHADWGWTALIPGFGLLANDFDEPYLHISAYNSSSIEFSNEIRIPTRPFAGTIGTCPSAHEHAPAIPPHTCGGNMDYYGLRAGSRLYLPVKVPGALFSAGDGHAAQGHGEVCGTAIETCLSMHVRLNLIKQQAIEMPRAEIPDQNQAKGKCIVTMGIGPDLEQACRDAVKFMIDELYKRYSLEPTLAYCLISCAGDLQIAQIVNSPNWTVVCQLPVGIFC